MSRKDIKIEILKELGNKICLFPGCNNNVTAYEFKNLRKSKNFCKLHDHTIEWNCSICNKIIKIDPNTHKELNQKHHCYSCSKIIQNKKYGSNLMKWHKENPKLSRIHNGNNGKKCLNKLWSDKNWSKNRLNILRSISGFKYEIKFCENCKSNQQFLYGKYCRNCEKEKCGNSDIIFNRDLFYEKQLELIKFNDENKTINLNEIDKYKNICGVWSIWSNDTCLDVCKTKDISNEIKIGIRCINTGIKNRNKTDEELDNENGIKRSYKYKKYRDIAKYENIIFKIVATNLSNEEALKIELQYAHKNKAIFWHI